MVEKPIKIATENVRTLVTAALEWHGVFMGSRACRFGVVCACGLLDRSDLDR